MNVGKHGEFKLVEFPTGDVYGVFVELVSHTVATGAVHVVATVTGVRYDVWGTPRPVTRALDELVVTRAQPWVAPPKRSRRRPSTPTVPTAAPAAPAAATPAAARGEAA